MEKPCTTSANWKTAVCKPNSSHEIPPDPLHLILSLLHRTLGRQRPGQHQGSCLNTECVGIAGRYRHHVHSRSVSATSTHVSVQRIIAHDPHPSKWCKGFPPPESQGFSFILLLGALDFVGFRNSVPKLVVMVPLVSQTFGEINKSGTCIL